MELNKKKLDNLYALYEFDKDKECEDCTVYIYEQGYFNNAEIVIFHDSPDRSIIQNIKNEYIETGFSVSIRIGNRYEELKRKLFDGFFKVELSNKKVMNEYKEYCKRQTKRLGGTEYSFIDSLYLHNGILCDKSIVDDIYTKMNQDGAQLVILEAPAGFGKTCTAYEISNRIAQNSKEKVPILAELSKNRSARIFSYVLLTEVDRKFPRLSSRLVTEQIKEGNIPLIIDGFDELLSKSVDDDEQTLEEAKTMLDTIANLLSEGSSAKILLTSRKSSIFTGDVFDEWVERKLFNCEVNRIQILNPTVSEWIGYEKQQYFEKKGIDLEYIANPVLLAMLRNESLQECETKYKYPYDILNHYFLILLNREKERQQLLIDVGEQKRIMSRLAAMMVELDISSDEQDGIQALIEEIVSPNISNYLSSYYDLVDDEDNVPPTEEEFIAKLTHSALLDRVGSDSNNIGFVNDFIFGILIGDAVIHNDLKVDELTDKYLNMASTAYAVESDENRKKFYAMIDSSKISLNTEQRIMLDMKVLGKIRQDFINAYFAEIIFREKISFMNTFLNCTFSNCTFEKNTVKSSVLQGCTFINCTFYLFEVEKSGIVEQNSVFISCNGHEDIQRILIVEEEKYTEKNSEYYEKLVLEQYWMKGCKAAEPRKTRRTLLKGIKQNERMEVNLAIERLIGKKVLRPLTYCIEMNFSEMTEIKRILGR